MKITKNSQKSELKKGTKLTQTLVTHIAPGRSTTKIETWTVAGHLNLKKGMRIRLLSEYGYGCTDVDFEWEPEFPTLSAEWETQE